MNFEEQIQLLKTLFKGRDDVFALRWDKGNKSGYMPAYHYDPYMYRLHKQKGGTFSNYKDKTYLKLDDHQLSRHIKGEQFIGVYPLLKDNTSWFIVADFDKKDWKEQSVKAVEVCKENGIPVYLERSRSGNGGHVWLFFEQPFPAIKSRKIILKLFEQAGIFSVFDKNTSFDRLFPNQDYLSGKGFGNLIALPLQGAALHNGNSCFIDLETFTPYKNQWQFLKTIKKVSTTRLDKILEELFKQKEDAKVVIKSSISNSGRLQIVLRNSIVINRNDLTPPIVDFLKEHLNFFNVDYAIKKKTGRSTWKTERYFKLIGETENTIEIPRGFIGSLVRFCKQQHIDYEFLDQRKRLDNVKLKSSIQLLKHQFHPIEKAIKKDFGIIVAPPGSGKTIIGLKIIEQKQQPALIVTHRKQIADQWTDRIETFFGISKKEIGKIGQGKMKIGKQVTVALIQTLTKKLSDENVAEKLVSAFGTIIIDECHHIPAKSFREVIHQLSPYYQYGLTATPFRKGNDEKLLFVYLGNIISEIKPQEVEHYKKARVVIQETKLNVPFNSKTDHFETLSKILVHDSERNKLILIDVQNELNSGRKAVIITERKEHIQTLYQYLKNQYEVIPISGDDNAMSRSMKWKSIQQGNYQAIITTGQFFGEGVDIQSISCLFLVYPFAFKGKLIQYIGRVQRSELTPVIYDYWDKQIPYLNKLFLKRNSYYRNLDRQATLFDDFKETVETITNNDIDKVIRVAIDDLDFHYEMVCFLYKSSNGASLAFEIENEEMQPEFEVLKPYFSQVLNSKSITVRVQIGFENDKVVSQLATSEDIDHINKEIVDSVKFQFIEQNFIRRVKLGNEEGIEETPKTIGSFFGSEENLLESLLKNSNYVHHRQLLYLSKRHQHKRLKIRFVLSPFSFVFLLEGEQKCHVVLETLDTKEATYIWHLPKEHSLFKIELERINQKLNWIRNNGRQSFLETKSENFSRIIHDYSEDKKGFYKWKNALEERLV